MIQDMRFIGILKYLYVVDCDDWCSNCYISSWWIEIIFILFKCSEVYLGI